MTGIVIVFVIFILIEREDLRDRLIGLAGARRVNVTTNLLNDAAQRVSATCWPSSWSTSPSVSWRDGPLFPAVPNPMLLGVLAALFRYIPYLGIWIAAAMPAAVGFAVEPGYAKATVIFGL